MPWKWKSVVVKSDRLSAPVVASYRVRKMENYIKAEERWVTAVNDGPTLRIFNPGHDIALASGLTNFTPPHAARGLQADLGYLPALWANEDDAVLVEDRSYAERTYLRLSARLERLGLRPSCDVNFVTRKDLHSLCPVAVDPWGWDPALRHLLERHGVEERCLPSVGYVGEVRRLSHRANAAELLRRLVPSGDGGSGCGRLVGCAHTARSMDEVRRFLGETGRAVLKAPWSSSGRGVRFVDGALSGHQEGWAANVLKTQGALMVEPHYRKVCDFGMEFVSDAQGRVCYQGLSLFTTVNGAYTGNLLATERVKRAVLSRYVDGALLDEVAQRICRMLSMPLSDGNGGDDGHHYVYEGPFGVDMMVVARDDEDGFLLHPCVEINLRRTMGHVALAISPDDDDNRRVMSIVSFNGGYKLLVNRASRLGVD